MAMQTAYVRQYLWSKPHIPTIPVALIGAGNVGKRSILQRFCHGTLTGGTRSSMMVPEWHKHVAVQGRDVHVQFNLAEDPFDMSEHDLLTYIRNNEAYVLVYDVMSRESFDVLERVHSLYARIPRRKKSRTPFFVVANKADRWRGAWSVPYAEGDSFARSIGATFLQMSSLTGSGTGDEVIVDWVSRVLLVRQQDEAERPPVPKPPASPLLTQRKAAWQDARSTRTMAGVRRVLNTPARLFDKLWPKPKSLLAQRSPNRDDSLTSITAPHTTDPAPSQSITRGRSMSGMRSRELRRSRDLFAALEEQPPPIPRLPGVNNSSAMRRSRALSLEGALSTEFYNEVRGEWPLSSKVHQQPRIL